MKIEATVVTYSCDACGDPIAQASAGTHLDLRFAVIEPLEGAGVSPFVRDWDLCSTCFGRCEASLNSLRVVLVGRS